jgi:hypothetical protein
MPTGYTAGIEDGRITTGKDFLKLCTRAFGIAIELKDEPLSVPTPTKFEPDTYYKKRLEDEKANFEKFKAMSFEEARAEMVRAYEDRIDMYKSMLEGSLKRNEQYAKVRAEVEDWNPPTPDHIELKKFALKQIDMCIDTQEQIDRYREYANEELDDSDSAVVEYIHEQTEFHRQGVKRAEESWDDEVKRTEDKNKWMELFLNSL